MIVLSACNAPFISGWVPYWNAPEGRLGFTSAAAPMFADVSPFFYSAQPDGTIAMVAGASATQLNTTVVAAQTRGIKVLPTITDGSGKLVMAALLADPTSRTQHVQNIVKLVVDKGFDGIDLDYEGFAFTDGRDSWATTQPVWDLFINELAAALHAQNPPKLLSVTIPPVWKLGTGEITGYTVYDQASIGAVADRIRLMVYDYSYAGGAPGPISPMSWLTQVIAYSDPIVPNNKLQLGVPSYGRDWGRQVNAKEICPDGALNTKSIELQNMQSLIDAHGATPTRRDPPNNGEMYFTYDVVVTGYSTKPIPAPPFVPPTHAAPVIPGPAIGATTGLQPALRLTPPLTQLSCTVRHFVYYPDATSIRQHAQAALSAGWSGVVIWALGYETADVYTELAQTAPKGFGQ